MHSARNPATAVAGAEGGGRGKGISLVLPAVCKNLLATTHTHTQSYEEEERRREKVIVSFSNDETVQTNMRVVQTSGSKIVWK